MEEGVRLGDYLVKAKHDRVVSDKVVLGGGNVSKTGVRPSVSSGKAENKTQVHEGKKEKKRPRLILSESESDEDPGTRSNVNGYVDRKLVKADTVNHIKEGGTGRNIIKIGGFKLSKEAGIDRRETKTEPSFARRKEGVINMKRIKVDNFKYHDKSGIAWKEIDVKAGPFKQKEDANFGRSEIKADHFKCRGEIENDRKRIKVDPFKEAEISRKRINVVDSFKYREEAEADNKRIKVNPIKCREEAGIDRKRTKTVPNRSSEESEAKAIGVKDVKLVTYVRQKEGRKGSSGNNLSDIRSQQPVLVRKNNNSTVVEKKMGTDHSYVQEYRMQKATYSHLGGIAKEKLRLSHNHSIRLQGTGGVLKLIPNHKKLASGLPDVSDNQRKAEGAVRDGRLEASLPMQKKVSHQPPGFDPKSSCPSSSVVKKNQVGRPSFLTDKTHERKPKGRDISMRILSPKSDKITKRETGFTPESSGVPIDVVPLPNKKMENKHGFVIPSSSKKLEAKHADQVLLSSKTMEARHAEVAPLSSKKMETKLVDEVSSSIKMMETKESLSSKKMETEHVDVIPLSGKKAETKMDEALRLRRERILLRERLRKMILDAGWKIELRPRRGRDYQDSVYICPKGTVYWSIVNAYNALWKEASCKDKEQMEIPMVDVGILTRITKARKIKEMGGIKDGKMSKKIKKHAGGVRSGKVRDGSQKKNSKGATKQHFKKKKHAKDNMHTSCSHRVKLNFGGKNKNSRGCALMVRGSSKSDLNPDDHYIPYSGKRNVLSWLIDSGVLPENGRLQYMNKKHTKVMMEGWITRDGIHCRCCSKILTVSKFEIHAGSKLRQPYQNILLETGISLMQCQLKAWNAQDESERRGFHFVDLDGSDENDDTCGICGDGGDLICCDSCPSTFHLSCLDLQSLPPGEWHCPHCSCRFCGVVGGSDQGKGAAVSQIVSCVQCEQKYHYDCAGEKDAMEGSSIVPRGTFCGKDCQKLFKSLQDLLGVKNDLDGGFSWTLIRRFDEDLEMSRRSLAQRAECNSKIAVALTVMDECFMPIIDQRSRINTIHNVVYNCGSNFNRLNYSGFYTVLLERGDDVISAASIRIHGTRLAEMPLIGTRHIYRRQGMCRRLLNAIESVLRSLKVEKLVIPAISELMQTWTVVFGFKPLEDHHKKEMKSMNMMVFPGTDMLQKQLFKQNFTGGNYTEALPDMVNDLKCCPHSSTEMANQSLVASAAEPILDASSEGNLCEDSGVTGSKEAPNYGSGLAPAEHNPCEYGEATLHDTCKVEVEGSAVEPNLPFGEKSCATEVSCETPKEAFEQNVPSSAMDTVPYPSDSVSGTPEIAPDVACAIASDGVNAYDASGIIGSKYAILGANHATGEYVVDGNGLNRVPSVPCEEDSDSKCTDTVNEFKCIKQDSAELANISLVASFVEANPHPSTEVTVHDTCEIKVEAAARKPNLPDFGEISVGHNPEFYTKSAEAASRSNFQSSSLDAITYTFESYKRGNDSHAASLVETNLHASHEVTVNDIYEVRMISSDVASKSSGDDILCYMSESFHKFPEASPDASLLLSPDEGNACDTSDLIGSRDIADLKPNLFSSKHIVDSSDSEALSSIPFEGTDIACTMP